MIYMYVFVQVEVVSLYSFFLLLYDKHVYYKSYDTKILKNLNIKKRNCHYELSDFF
jgi:hypothetical protein